jgi:hypothetical protein
MVNLILLFLLTNVNASNVHDSSNQNNNYKSIHIKDAPKVIQLDANKFAHSRRKSPELQIQYDSKNNDDIRTVFITRDSELSLNTKWKCYTIGKVNHEKNYYKCKVKWEGYESKYDDLFYLDKSWRVILYENEKNYTKALIYIIIFITTFNYLLKYYTYIDIIAGIYVFIKKFICIIFQILQISIEYIILAIPILLLTSLFDDNDSGSFNSESIGIFDGDSERD